MPGRTYTVANGYRYGVNGKEKDDEVKGNGNSLDFGARIHDPRLGRWLSGDPAQQKYPSISTYDFATNSPIYFVDQNGKWLGVTMVYFELDIGAGLGWGVNYVEQSGMAYDDIGKTHFKMTSAIYIVNQKLGTESGNNAVLGVGASLSGGVTQDWKADVFSQSVDALGLNPGISAKVGLGLEAGGAVGFDENGVRQLGISLGVGAGAKVSILNTDVAESISLTYTESNNVNSMSNLVERNWNAMDQKPITDAKGNVTGFEANVYVDTRDKNGNVQSVNTGIKVYSGASTDANGNTVATKMWESTEYKTKADEKR